MVYIMKYKSRKWYLKGIYSSYDEALQNGKKMRKQKGGSYKINKTGILGDYELWVSKRGF